MMHTVAPHRRQASHWRGRLQETFRLCQKHCDGIVLVDSAQISAAIKDVFQETRSVLEPAGAVALAGAEAYLAHHDIKVLVRRASPFVACR